MALPDTKILVWDAPVRTFHWLLVGSFFGSYLTAESETWRLLHVTLGYTLGGLIAFRLVWGVLGTRYARFGSFVRSPSAVGRYLKTMVAGRPERYIGHNPAGGVAIVLLLLLGDVLLIILILVLFDKAIILLRLTRRSLSAAGISCTRTVGYLILLFNYWLLLLRSTSSTLLIFFLHATRRGPFIIVSYGCFWPYIYLFLKGSDFCFE